MDSIIKLIRWPNLIILILVQLSFYYLYLNSFNTSTELFQIEWTGLIGIILSTVTGASAGYVINDLFDIKADTANQKHRPFVTGQISIRQGSRLYLILLLLSITFAVLSGSFLFTGFVFILNGIMYSYARWLKKIGFIGNLLIAFVIGFSTIFPIFLYPLEEWPSIMGIFPFISFAFPLFGFTSTLLRELLKDVEDQDGDQVAGYRTLPITHGFAFVKKVGFILVILFAGLDLFHLAYLLQYKNPMFFILNLSLVFIPGLIIGFILNRASNALSFRYISQVCKVWMVSGILYLSIILILIPF